MDWIGEKTHMTSMHSLETAGAFVLMNRNIVKRSETSTRHEEGLSRGEP
ncbi:hypothetical protein N007_04340 [Alicyclobacillus acidoterrestris ATCC 49025]|nr:hypothetical protein N007_04340 [Alicyclobacillus acidoterrestris ATCC 49025]